MKAVMLSIQPKWVDKIIKGEKTIEVRKNRPKLETPFKCYIYCTKHKEKLLEVLHKGDDCYGVKYDNDKPAFIKGFADTSLIGYWGIGKVVGEFVVDDTDVLHEWELSPCKKFYDYEKERLDLFLEESCLSLMEICSYRQNLPYYKPLYGLHISDLKIYDKPKELGEFKRPCIMPEEPYCPCCKHGSVIYSEDEIEYALYHGGYCDTSEWVCHNCVKRPPQSWCYVEVNDEREIDTSKME